MEAGLPFGPDPWGGGGGPPPPPPPGAGRGGGVGGAGGGMGGRFEPFPPTKPQDRATIFRKLYVILTQLFEVFFKPTEENFSENFLGSEKLPQKLKNGNLMKHKM